MASSRKKISSDGPAAFDLKIKMSMQVLAGVTALVVAYLGYLTSISSKCMETCAALIEAVHQYH